LALLAIGCGWRPLLRYLDTKPHFDRLRVSAADVVDAALYRKDAYAEYFIGDLTGGYPEIPSASYDVVVCEQVLEHLDRLDTALDTLVRVLRPGGTLVIGVPIFLPPLHLARRYLVPPLARLLGHPDSASDPWKVAQRAEELGFTHAWFYDTQMITADPFVAMAAAALKTSKIRLGTGVLVPSNRIAAVTANAFATLNGLAPGRVDFGV